MNGRVERLRAEMERLEIASFLVSNPVNVRYLTGFESSNAFVLVKYEEVVLMTDGRYAEAGRAVEGVENQIVERDFLPGVATVTWSDSKATGASASRPSSVATPGRKSRSTIWISTASTARAASA